MAIVKMGVIVVDIKGKIGGTIFQGGRSATVMRTKNNGSKQQVVNQQLNTKILFGPISNRFGAVTKGWSKLTEVQRATWSDLLEVWTFTDKFGDTYNGTPFQIFTAVNLNRLQIDQAQFTSAPTFSAATDLGVTFEDYSLTGTWNLVMANTATLTQKLIVKASANQNPTKSVQGTSKRAITLYTGKGNESVDLKAAYLAAYGNEPILGSVIFVETWNCKKQYPRQQFTTTAVVTVVE